MFKNRGFTLIELMVVIAIIGFLASVVLASLNASRTKGENAATVRQVREYITAINLAYGPNGNEFPTYGGALHGCLVVTNTSAGDRCYFRTLVLSYPETQRDIIGQYILLKPFDSPVISSTGGQYDSVMYSSDGDTFTLRYPIKGSTDCLIEEATQFGAADGNVIVCQYTSR